LVELKILVSVETECATAHVTAEYAILSTLLEVDKSLRLHQVRQEENHHALQLAITARSRVEV
jgi:hypothetical protein